jgi:hypothetical protein
MLDIVLSLMRRWKPVFAQERSARRAIAQALATVCVIGRRTVARSIVARGGAAQPFDAEYKLLSRSPWSAQQLFVPIFDDAIAMSDDDLIVIGGDDTRVRKAGKRVAGAGWGRDPLSPPFWVNLQWGLRFLHAAVLIPVHQTAEVAARAVPVWFELVPPPRKPGRRATPDEWAAYRAAKRERRLSNAAVAMLVEMRHRADQAGAAAKSVLGVFDGSFANKVVFSAHIARTKVIARVRRDARLCFRAPTGSRRVYSRETFTPDQIRQDRARRYQRAAIFHGGARREVRYKQLSGVLWRGGGGRRPLRLIVVAPTPYRRTKRGRWMYRQPAYLLSTDLRRPARTLLQAYFDRWQLEVAHREMKDTFGVGQAQVRIEASVARQPVLSVATYSALHVAALRAFGPHRPASFGPLPKWQREKSRPSGLDLSRQLRKDLLEGRGRPLGVELELTPAALLETSTT